MIYLPDGNCRIAKRLQGCILVLLGILVLLNPARLRALDDKSAVITGERVRVRDAAATTGRIITHTGIGNVVTVLGSSKGQYRLDRSRDYYYRWYRVRGVLPQNGKHFSGWIYGQYLYLLRAGKRSGSVRFGGKTFQLAVFSEPGITKAEMPESDSYSLPFFYISGSPVAYPLYCRRGTLKPLHYRGPRAGLKYPYFRLVSNTGFGEAISLRGRKIKKAANNICHLPFLVHFQEGAAQATLVIEYRQERFELLKIINYRETGR